jgi:hypothetical protein
MMTTAIGPGETGLEVKYCQTKAGLSLVDGMKVEGYASLFGQPDRSGDVVEPGAYAASLAQLGREGRKVKMLWQHDPGQPIGVWDEVREDRRGLFVRGRLLRDVARGREAAALVEAGAIDGLSIGYRTKQAARDRAGRRLLHEIELWEVSLVTFPMLAEARVGRKEEDPCEDPLHDLVAAIESVRQEMGAG